MPCDALVTHPGQGVPYLCPSVAGIGYSNPMNPKGIGQVKKNGCFEVYGKKIKTECSFLALSKK